jgi:hypothetical protein
VIGDGGVIGGGDLRADVRTGSLARRCLASEPVTAGRNPVDLALTGVGRTEVGESGQQVLVRTEAGWRDLAVGQPGEAHAVDVVGG